MSPSQNLDDAMPVIDYIVGEMNRNSAGPEANRIRTLNTFSADSCIADWQRQSLLRQLLTSNMPRQCIDMELTGREAAIVSWSLLVRQGGPWDHKKYIRSTFHPRHALEQVWHRLGNWEYYYDIWSNIHYGYVGLACGFSKSTLLNGAGLEQVGSDILRKRWPQQRPGVSGMAAFDDASDQVAIGIGAQLYIATPRSATSAQVRRIVESTPGLDKKAVPPTRTPT